MIIIKGTQNSLNSISLKTYCLVEVGEVCLFDQINCPELEVPNYWVVAGYEDIYT